jgi:hypothetical protein
MSKDICRVVLLLEGLETGKTRPVDGCEGLVAVGKVDISVGEVASASSGWFGQ